jgi:hypothetical protein
MEKGMTFTLIVVAILFVIIFVISILLLTVGKDYLFKSLSDFPSLFGGSK